MPTSARTPAGFPTPIATALATVGTSPTPMGSGSVRAWAAGLRFVSRSDDSAQTWGQVLNLGFAAAFGVDFVDRNTGWVVGEERIFHTRNGALNWEDQTPKSDRRSSERPAADGLDEYRRPHLGGNESPELLDNGVPRRINAMDCRTGFLRSALARRWPYLDRPLDR